MKTITLNNRFDELTIVDIDPIDDKFARVYYNEVLQGTFNIHSDKFKERLKKVFINEDVEQIIDKINE